MKASDAIKANAAAWRLKGRDAYADFLHQHGLSDDALAAAVRQLSERPA